MAEMSFAEGFALLERRTKLASKVIWAVFVLSIATIFGDIFQAIGIVDFDAYDGPSPLSWLFLIAYLFYLLAFLISVVMVSMWIYRAHDNLRSAGVPELEFTPGWSVGWFFVPIMNLFKPFQAMKELWNASYGTSNAYGAQAPSSIGTWWAFWVVGTILGNVSFRMTMSGQETGISLGLILSALSGIFLAGAAWFLLRILREVLEGQRNHLQVQEAFA